MESIELLKKAIEYQKKGLCCNNTHYLERDGIFLKSLLHTIQAAINCKTVVATKWLYTLGEIEADIKNELKHPDRNLTPKQLIKETGKYIHKSTEPVFSGESNIKELTPEEIILKMGWTYDSDPGRHELWETLIKPAMEEYAQMEVKEKVNKFIEFCADNYSLEIPTRIVDDFKTTS